MKKNFLAKIVIVAEIVLFLVTTTSKLHIVCGSFDIVYEAIIAQNDDNNARVDEDLQMDQIESVTASKCVKKLLRYEILVMRLNIEYHTYYIERLSLFYSSG